MASQSMRKKKSNSWACQHRFSSPIWITFKYIVCLYVYTVLNLRPFEKKVLIRSFNGHLSSHKKCPWKKRAGNIFDLTENNTVFWKTILTSSIFQCFFLYWQTCLVQSSTIISWRVSGFQQRAQQFSHLTLKMTWQDLALRCRLFRIAKF